MVNGPRRFLFRPFSFLYYGVLLVLLIVVVPVFTGLFRDILVEGVGLPPEAFGAVLFLSLIGSSVNIPLTTVEAKVPIQTYREVRFFFVTWRIPSVEMGIRKTYVTINLGGAVVPILISAYLILFSIPACSPNIFDSYVKLLVVLLTVTIWTHRNARIIKGLGIATPMFGPPATTAFATLVLDVISPISCPTQIAYVGGTLGALIGADLLNLNKLPEVGAPVASIGGAGTFDGIYLTGLLSVLLVLLLL
ncbi:MAG: DUF1614 domain-containing protein [Candidatus Bathyarchaeota archaeon]|nr:DUF1614 domain-containing protein [Candidatus Bathyarchaeota archaeon]